MQHAMHQGKPAHEGRAKGHYWRLLAMAVLSFLAMYALMYAMVDRWGNVYSNLNQFYMAGLMAAPMVIIELLLMASMYPNRKHNLVIVILSLIAMALCWIAIRQQTAITDRQFLKSMIPHHASAILMCGQNRLKDPELQQLCGKITSSQQAEIDFMQSKLD